MLNDDKMLPINLDPLIKTYPYNAVYLGILEACEYNVSNLIANDFFKVFYFEDNKGSHIDFCKSGNIEKNRFNKKYDIDKFHINSEFIKNKLNNNYYLLVNLNEKLLNVKDVYRPFDFYHDWYIYGYNNTTETFLCCGYIPKKHGAIFGSIDIPFDNLIMSIRNVPWRFNLSRAYNLKNHSFKINPNWNEPSISKEQILKQIKNFYSIKRTPIIKFKKLHFATNCLAINKYIKSFEKKHISNSNNENDRIFLQDIRTFHEHQKVWGLLLNYVTEDSKIISKQKNHINITRNNLLLAQKYNLCPNKKIAEEIYHNLIISEKGNYEIAQSLCEESMKIKFRQS